MVVIGSGYPPIVLKGDSTGVLDAAGKNKRVLYISGGANVTLGSNLTLRGGNTSGQGGGVYITGPVSQFKLDGGMIQGNSTDLVGGGVVIDSGSFEMLTGTIGGSGSDRNTAGSYGGGVFVNGVTGGSFTMKGGDIYGNLAQEGGGVYVSDANFEMQAGTISANKAAGTAFSSGGGVCISGNTSNFKMTGSGVKTIHSNTATMEGGGVYVHHGTFEMESGTIGGDSDSYANRAAKGGGVCIIIDGNFKMTGTGTKTIGFNTAVTGGGIYQQGTGDLTIVEGAVICGNKATGGSGGGICFDSYGILSMEGGIIGGSAADENTALAGGGVYVSGGDFTMSAGEISYNRITGSIGSGGGVFVYTGDFSMTGSAAKIISHNSAINQGGGIFIEGRTLAIVSGAVISSNDARGVGEGMGGGIYVGGTTDATMSGGIIGGSIPADGNTGNYAGGGLYIYDSASFTLSGDGTISYNTAAYFGNGVLVNGTFIMSGDAVVNANNDVYLKDTTKRITIGAALTAVDDAATITPSDYIVGDTVLSETSGGLINTYYSRFKVTPKAYNPTIGPWSVDSAGKLAYP
jgi:hypothetical protein